MAITILRRVPYHKPPAGSIIDPTHPLAQGLFMSIPLNEGVGNQPMENWSQQVMSVGAAGLNWRTMGEAGTASPWGGVCLLQDRTNGPYVRVSIKQNPLFQIVPDNQVGWSMQYLICPTVTTIGTAERLGDTDHIAACTVYLNHTVASTLEFNFRNSANSTQVNRFNYTLGQWLHVVAACRQSEMRFYINGVLATINGGTGSNPNTGTLDVNKTWTNNPGQTLFYMVEGPAVFSAPFFDGYIADCKLYNRYLYPEDVAWLYNEPWAYYVTHRPRFRSFPAGSAIKYTNLERMGLRGIERGVVIGG